MKRSINAVLVVCGLLSAGCVTTEQKTEPLSWREQQGYLMRVRDPRLYGLGIYQTPAGPRIRGGGRLHPSQAEALPMLAEEPARPVVSMNGRFGVTWPVLLDCTAPVSVFEFDTALEAGAFPVAEGSAQVMRRPGEEIPSVISLIPSIRMGQLYVENQMLLVRMANGAIGPAARGIEKPAPAGVLGWDVLKNFAQVQFLYSINQVVLKTTEEYRPNPTLLAAQVLMAEHAGACAVRGTVNGESGWILIDPAGDFEVAAGPDVAIQELRLSDSVAVSVPTTVVSAGGIRLGARFLARWNVTICPQAGLVFFEQPARPED